MIIYWNRNECPVPGRSTGHQVCKLHESWIAVGPLCEVHESWVSWVTNCWAGLLLPLLLLVLGLPSLSSGCCAPLPAPCTPPCDRPSSALPGTPAHSTGPRDSRCSGTAWLLPAQQPQQTCLSRPAAAPPGGQRQSVLVRNGCRPASEGIMAYECVGRVDANYL